MNELEIKEKSTTIYELSQEIHIHSQENLIDVIEILRGIKEHKEKVIDYWKTAKESARKAYKEIVSKEKAMLEICDKAEKNLKNEILIYKRLREQKAIKISDEAEKYRQEEVDKLLNESIKAEQNGDKETSRSKLRQAEMIENLEKYTAKVFQKEDGITTQKRWQVRITDNESVPVFFNGIEIREINTKKLLEIRKENPNVQIPGVEFYQMENIVIRK